MLLWYPSQVSFKPVRANWTFSDGEKAQGDSITRSWGATGSYQAQLAVDYSVRYRILGRTGWIVLPGNVTSRSAPIDLMVSQGSAQEGGKVVLVHWNCFQKPLSPSC